jgi:hypothetical protein
VDKVRERRVMWSRNRTIGVLATAGLVGVSSVVAAENLTFAGAACVENYGDTDVALRTDGIIFNGSDSTGILSCPIVRPNSNESGDITGVRVRVRDEHPSHAVECWAVSCDGFRENCSYTDLEASASVQTTSLALDDMATYTNGFAYIECQVPPRITTSGFSGILSYKITD